MSDSNIGGRQNKSGINHIWVMQSIIHENMSSVKKVPIVIQQYGYRQMFDGMDSSEACGDIYDYGVNDDHLTLIHEGNEEVVISVKTSYGLSKEYKLTSRIMQGDTWACAEASAQVDSFGKEMLEENPNYMYKYMGVVPIPLLGQVDDLIGVAEAGFKSKQLNSFVNVKTADKDLQFGPEKCKTMVVSKKNVHSFQNPDLEVDAWHLKHEPNGNMKEEFIGKVKIDNEKSLLYLGHVLAEDGNNMPNILHKRNRSLGTQKLIPKLIKNLGGFTFEGGIIYLQSLLRTSILYGSETMFNIKEKEFRIIEAIEESVLQKIFHTKRSCSRHLLYLE